jgi:hypothetical protein
LSWNYIFGNEVGTSHLRAGTRCQDEVAVAVERTADGRDVLAIFVCDGAGSAAQGGTGAELAVQASLDFLAEHATRQDFELNDGLARALLGTARKAIDERGAQSETAVREYACTYLAVLSADSLGTMVIQLGDGGIVVDLGEGLRCLTEPMNGEYANSTRFLTEAGYLEIAQTRCVGTRVDRAAIFTDGLQSLGVDQATNTPHDPFFYPFFEALESTSLSKDEDHPLQGAFSRFLQSDQVNQRTDDDKSLAVAVWMAAEPPIESQGSG